MNRAYPLISLLTMLLVVLFPRPASSKVVSRYVTLSYANQQLLRDFNDEVVLNSKLRYYMRQQNVVTVRDEVLAKLDVIIEKAEVVLDMFPNNLHFTVVLLPDSGAVSSIYKKKYGKGVDDIAYYSLSEKTIYVSVADVNLRVIAHEIGHAVVDRYFKVRPPYNIHELLAQYTEKHITD